MNFSPRIIFSFLSFFFIFQNDVFSQDPVYINISGDVRHIDTGKPIEDAEIYFHDGNNEKVLETTTDDLGNFSINTSLTPGDIMDVEVYHPNFKIKRGIQLTISKYNTRNRLPNILLIPKDDNESNSGPGEKLSIAGHVYDRKSLKSRNKKPVVGAIVEFFDSSNRKISVGKTDENGYYIFYPIAVPGQEIQVRIQKPKKYKLKVIDYTIKEGTNRLDVYLKRKKKIKTEHILLGKSIGFAIPAVIYKIRCVNKYSDYKTPSNFETYQDWQDTKKQADDANTVFGVTATVTGVCLTSYFLYKYWLKDRWADDTEQSIYVPDNLQLNLGQNEVGIGLQYSF